MLREDLLSGVWANFEKQLEKDLQDCYKHLANPDTTREKTEQYRGRAAYISMLLSMKSLPQNGAE